MRRQWKWIWLICMLASLSAIAQDKKKKKNSPVTTINNQRVKPPGALTLSRDTIFDVVLYEHSHFQGRRGYFVKIAGKIVAPFSTNNISVKVPEDKIVYIKTEAEFPVEIPFVSSSPMVTLDPVIGVRSDDLTGVHIEFQGISTTIHTSDCKRVYGSIKLMLVETAPGANPVQSNLFVGKFSQLRGRQDPKRRDYFLIYNRTLLQATPVTRWGNYFIYDGDPYNLRNYPRNERGINGNTVRVKAPDSCYFYAGKNALREGRVKLIIETNLTSAHKNCSSCDDYTSNIKMTQTGHDVVTLNIFKQGTRIVDTMGKELEFGPYHAEGIRDGFAITATSRIFKEFKTYFKIKYFN